MSQNQVFTPSGISTRGADLDTIPSSSAGLDQDDQQSQIIQQIGEESRPLTSQSKFQFINDQQYNSQNLSIIQSSSQNNSFLSILDKFNNNSQLTSLSLHLKVSKLNKLEKKKLQKQNELIKEIQNWCNILTNDECKKLLYNYIKILELEIDTMDQLMKKREFINGQLLNVNKREKRTTELKLKRNKILVKLRDNENKVGDSPITTLTKENLEELECSVEIVEDQFIRSINTGLRNSLAEYSLTLQNQTFKLKDTSKKFLDNYHTVNSNTGNSNNNLQRLILQNKLNSGYISREISSSANTAGNPKYIALSPNQIGKYLDNRFVDVEDNSMPPPQTQSSAQLSQSPKINSESRQQQQQQQRPNTSGLSISDAELKSKGILPSHYQNIQVGPPPTASSNQKIVQQQIQHEHSNNNNSDNESAAYNIINHYSTPGGLGGIRPGSNSNNHEWT